ncbi:MAG: 2-oxo acid dehydrogenase subunit E2 [Saprospiraceae bacterium]|nr:2-oxo acid dehydrogenase subunit E2 [Saprospiraceae bacterium]
MARIELIMPKMGESIIEATILKWNKQIGDTISIDDTVLEIATDKVDSEVPSPVAGVLAEILYKENDVVGVGKPIAIITTEGTEVAASPSVAIENETNKITDKIVETTSQPITSTNNEQIQSSGDRFYSPLVKNIAKTENISQAELDAISGSGLEGRVTKKDILEFVENRGKQPVATAPKVVETPPAVTQSTIETPKPATSVSGNVEIVEMDRMRRLIADHMVHSKHTAPHVTSFVEADVTNMVNWRNKVKKEYQNRYNENITFTPLFIEAVVRAIKDYPLVNISVEGYNLIVKKDINIGMAAALPSGNLIVPVIKNADMLSLAGLTKSVNDKANRARKNQLKPDEIQGGTFTITNVGTFGNIMGTPIINQPQVAILATGAIQKKPAVIETEFGDVIAIRHMMFLSLSYDHRVVDGSLGGAFLKRIAEYMEGFDINRPI